MAGYYALVLHAHLPFVRHPEHRRFLEEDWFFEALSDTYVPLLALFEKLLEEDVRFQVTLSVSPPLLNMLEDTLLLERYRRRLEGLIELAAKEVVRTRWEPKLNPVAAHYHATWSATHRQVFDAWGGHPLRALKRLVGSPAIEPMATAATHAYLPLAAPAAQRVQIQLGISEAERCLGVRPRAFWLPECGVDAALPNHLAAAGVTRTVVETHATASAAPLGTAGGVVAFKRDPATAHQIWSMERGYPGDPVYRDFHRDIGWDLDYQYVRPYLPAAERSPLGIKYHRVTGPTTHKAIYDVALATARATEHAQHFVQTLKDRNSGESCIVSPYDAELFGHWWYEGPQFLEWVLRTIALDQNLTATTLSGYLAEHPAVHASTLQRSSWGEGGDDSVWRNTKTEWMYPELDHATERMVAMAGRFAAQPTHLEERALNQAARELLLAQASDWAFIMRTGTMETYASRRVRTHLARFGRLEETLSRRSVDPAWLAEIEARDTLFPELDFRIYCADPPRAGAPPTCSDFVSMQS